MFDHRLASSSLNQNPSYLQKGALPAEGCRQASMRLPWRVLNRKGKWLKKKTCTFNQIRYIASIYQNKAVHTPPDLGRRMIFTKSGMSLFSSLYNLSWSSTAIISTVTKHFINSVITSNRPWELLLQIIYNTHTC